MLLSNCDVVVTGALKTPRDYLVLSQLIGSRTIRSMFKGKGRMSESVAGFRLKTFAEWARANTSRC